MTLGVLAYGDSSGYPFNHLVGGGIKHVNGPKDLSVDMKAVVFWGGTDIWAGLYGQKPNKYNQNRFGISLRDTIEWNTMKEAILNNIPIIGVCRGAQMLCAMAGGTLIQHVGNHHSTHELITSTGDKGIHANSCHHQMMQLPKNSDVELLAWTEKLSDVYLGEDNRTISPPDKEPEVVHFKAFRAIGIQGHPEWLEPRASFVDYCLDTIKDRILV